MDILIYVFIPEQGTTLLFVLACIWIVAKLIIANMICDNPELSNKKVRHLTRMFRKNKD